MARVLGRRVLFGAASIAGVAGVFLLATSSLKAEDDSSSLPLHYAVDSDISRLKNYLIEVNGGDSPSISRRDGGAEDITRLQNYLDEARSGEGLPFNVAQNSKDDLLTPPGPSGPAQSGSGKPSSNDLLAPAPGGNDLLTPGGNKPPEDVLKVAPAKESDESSPPRRAQLRPQPGVEHLRVNVVRI